MDYPSENIGAAVRRTAIFMGTVVVSLVLLTCIMTSASYSMPEVPLLTKLRPSLIEPQPELATRRQELIDEYAGLKAEFALQDSECTGLAESETAKLASCIKWGAGLHRRLSAHIKSRAAFNKEVASASKTESKKQSLDGWNLVSQGSHTAAVAKFKEAVALSPKDEDAAVDLMIVEGLLAQDQGDDVAATKKFAKVLAERPFKTVCDYIERRFSDLKAHVKKKFEVGPYRQSCVVAIRG